MKYLGINLTKCVQDMYALITKYNERIKEDQDNWKVHRLEEQHNKDVDSPQIHTSPIKTPATYFVDIGKLTLNLYWNAKDLYQPKQFFKK